MLSFVLFTIGWLIGGWVIGGILFVIFGNKYHDTPTKVEERKFTWYGRIIGVIIAVIISSSL